MDEFVPGGGDTITFVVIPNGAMLSSVSLSFQSLSCV